jgi:hypothetical protein
MQHITLNIIHMLLLLYLPACSVAYGTGLWANITRTLVVKGVCPAGEIVCPDGLCSIGECDE